MVARALMVALADAAANVAAVAAQPPVVNGSKARRQLQIALSGGATRAASDVTTS